MLWKGKAGPAAGFSACLGKQGVRTAVGPATLAGEGPGSRRRRLQ